MAIQHSRCDRRSARVEERGEIGLNHRKQKQTDCQEVKMKYLEKEKELIKDTEKEIGIIVNSQLLELLRWNPDRSFIELELELCRRLNEIGAKMLESLIPKIYGDGYIGPRKDINIDSEYDEDKISYRCETRNKARSLQTVFGTIRISRAVYSEFYSGGQKSFLDEKLQIEDKKFDPLIGYWTDLLGIIAPFEEASDILNKIRGIKVSSKQVQLSTEATAKNITDSQNDKIKDIFIGREGKISQANINLNLNAKRTVYIETDGCQLHTENGWNECKTFMLFELEKVSEEKNLLKNKYYFSTMGDVGEIKRQLKYSMERYCGSDEVRIICIGDGAKWIWNMMQELMPKNTLNSGAIEIVDWFHAVEKIGNLFEEIMPKSANKSAFVEPFKDYLKNGNIELVEQELHMLMEKQQNPEYKNEVYEAMNYFINNKERMRYDKYKESGICMGSGAIESANKYVVQRRVKLQGMIWELANLNYMVHFRAEYINNKMDAYFGIHDNPIINAISVS